MTKKKTHEEYVAELAEKNPTVEVVGKYIDALTKIKHHCLIHDVYWDTTPSRALHGVGCNECHKERDRESRCKTNEQYISEIEKINPDIVVMEKYIDAKTPILHKCLTHNVEWKTSPDNILHGHGCYLCGNKKNGDAKRKTHEQYVEELKIVNPNIVVVDSYISALTPILHKCLIDGNEWYVSPANTLFGYGCPRCNKSKGEKQIAKWLDSNNIYYEHQKAFDDCKDKRPLPFDFYIPDYNCCIEYDGEQHYRAIEYFGGEESFKLRIKHDNIKTEYCIKHGILLLRIPYFKNAEEELNNFSFI